MKKAWKITIGVLSFFVVFYIFVWIFPNADYEKIGRIICWLIPILGYYFGMKFWEKRKNQNEKEKEKEK